MIGSTVDRGRAVLFSAPLHSNVGDQMILLGARDYLRSIHDELVIVNEHAKFRVKSSDTIYFLGGGNFGDLYAPTHLDKIRRLRTFEANKVIFLPQSVFLRKHRSIIQTRKAFGSYRGELILFARDNTSKTIADNYLEIEAQLLPDSAILLQPKLKKWLNGIDGRGALYVRREDAESKRKFSLGLPTSDIMFAGVPLRPELSIRLVGSLIAARKLIITDRLHAALLAVLIGRHAILLPNRYHKNEAFYKTWFIPGLSFASTRRDIGVLTSKVLSDNLAGAIKRNFMMLRNKYLQSK
ncbi:MAG TPA: polysaccharide pyruvyl transferase family protein [Candidatus Bathyarchaeia archaeon]|nr:polysaccharide pyruvyl transferase family protein [Candidatus Bathyarchaeia archaeon]